MTTDANIRQALRQVIDPELGVNIVDLGLVYRVEVEGARARVVMTTSSPACPLGEYLRTRADDAIRAVAPELSEVIIEMVYQPSWRPDMMSDEARRQLTGRA